jgi:hypothetical protein
MKLSSRIHVVLSGLGAAKISSSLRRLSLLFEVFFPNFILVLLFPETCLARSIAFAAAFWSFSPCVDLIKSCKVDQWKQIFDSCQALNSENHICASLS